MKTSKTFQSATSPAAPPPTAQPDAGRHRPAPSHSLPAGLPTEHFTNIKTIFTDGSKDASSSRICSGVYFKHTDTTSYINTQATTHSLTPYREQKPQGCSSPCKKHLQMMKS